MSRMLRALGLMGAGLTGIAKGQAMYDEREERREDREARKTDREYMRSLREQERADRERLRQAGTVGEIAQTQTYQPAMDDEGNPMPANPAPIRFVTEGMTFDTRDAATSAAHKAAGDRVYATMRGIDPVRAEALRSSQLGSEAAQLQLDKAKLDELNRVFDEELLSKVPRGADGMPEPKALEAAFLQSRRATPAEKLRFLVEAEQRRKTESKDDRDFDLRKRHTEAQVRALDAQTDANERKAKSTFERMDEVDKIKLTNLQKSMETIRGEIVKAQASGMWDENQPNAKSLRTQLAALALQERQLIAKYADAGTARPDPLGLSGKGSASAVATSDERRVSAEDQHKRDVEAGLLMVRSDYGGDMARAQAELERLRAEADKATGELRQITESAARRLSLGIEAARKQQTPKPPKPKKVEDKASMSEAVSSIEQLDTPTLARIAAIPGHAKQREAIEILRQRQAAAARISPPADTAAAALGFGA